MVIEDVSFHGAEEKTEVIPKEARIPQSRTF